ncbi:MAG: hypothetical protein JW776_02960 [Candidatus Lokiarchaeota archaeon]|nr:hypothetical protein [Candidatus Lokiarchaeota archaeon]
MPTKTINDEIDKEFEDILKNIAQKGILTIESIDRLSKLFSIEQISKVKEIMGEIVKVTFIPSSRIVWMKLGTDRDYLLYPKKYCSCMDFYLQGILKNRKYYCKHLIAQGIVAELTKKNPQSIEIVERDENFKEKVTQQLSFEHFLI